MSDHYKSRKHHYAPLYYRKSKAAMVDKTGYNDYSISDTTVAFNSHYKTPRSMKDERNRYKSKYDSDFEYENRYDYDYSSDEPDCECFGQTKNKKNDRRYDYDSEEKIYERLPGYMRKYKHYGTETMNEYDSNSDYSLSEIPIGRREFDRTHRRYPTDTTDTERSYYDSHQPRSHHGYKYERQQNRILERSNNETTSNTETQKTTEDSDITKSQTQTQVYMTLPTSDNTTFSKERLLSVVDYNENTSPLKQKKPNNTDIERINSELVYVPVIFQDKPYSKHKITTSKLVVNNSGDEQLQSPVQVFVAGNLEHENIFDQSNNTPIATHESLTPSVVKRKSTILSAIRRLTGSKIQPHANDVNETDYPVKRSYIKVAPNSHKSRTHNEDNIQTASVSDHVFKSHDGNPNRKSGILKEFLGKHKKSSSALRQSHLGHHRTSSTVKKNKNNKEEGSTAVKDNKKSLLEDNHHVLERDNRRSEYIEVENQSSHMPNERKSTLKKEPRISSFVENRKSNTRGRSESTEVNQQPSNMINERRSTLKREPRTSSFVENRKSNTRGRSESTEVNQQPSNMINERRSTLKKEPHESSFLEHFRKSKIGDFQRNSSVNKNDQQNDFSTNKDLRKSLTKPQRVGHGSEVRNTLSDDKHQTLSVVRLSNTGKESPHINRFPVKQHLSNEHLRNTAPTHNIEQSQTTGLDKKSSTSLSSKRDDRHKKEHSKLPKFMKSRKKKEKKNKLSNLPPSADAEKKSIESNHSIKIWGYDIIPFVYVFQAAQFFLGLTMHEKLMELVNHYYKT